MSDREDANHCAEHCHPACTGGEPVWDRYGEQVGTLPHVGKFRHTTWEDGYGGCPICLRQASEAVGRFLAETPLGREMAAIGQRVADQPKPKVVGHCDHCEGLGCMWMDEHGYRDYHHRGKRKGWVEWADGACPYCEMQQAWRTQQRINAMHVQLESLGSPLDNPP